MGSVLRLEPGKDAVVDLTSTEGAVPPSTEELVTILIPARNEEGFIGACLESILAQTWRRLQVIVVDGDSSDRTREVVERYAEQDPRVELMVNPNGSIPASLNVGLGAARGKWLVRVDAHSTIPPGYVGAIVNHLSTGRWGGVGGRKDAIAETPTGRAIATALASPFGVGNSTYHHGTKLQTVDHIPFGAYPTSLLREIGGWDERLSANEDYELDHRVRRGGGRLLFDPSVTIAWRSRETIRDLFRQYRRYGRGKAAVVRMHPGSVRLRHLAAPALVAGWAAALAVALRWPIVLAFATVPYLLALGIAGALTARRAAAGVAWPRVAVAFAAMHVGWGIGFWEGLARELWVLCTGRGRR